MVKVMKYLVVGAKSFVGGVITTTVMFFYQATLMSLMTNPAVKALSFGIMLVFGFWLTGLVHNKLWGWK